MTPCQKIKREILMSAIKQIKDNYDNMTDEEKELSNDVVGEITEETVDNQYSGLVEMDFHQDYESDFRSGEVETNIPCDYSRHYESKSVAAKMRDGSWVGWTYWYGGGKHGEPGAVEWMDDAYDLELTEIEKLVVVREFKKK